MEPAVIHIDLDGTAEIYEAHGWRYQAPGDPLFDSGLRHALDFFDAVRIRATLFVIGRQLDDPAKRALLQEAVRRGHQIASHTVTHRSLTTLSAAEKRREIVDSRRQISDALGVDVEGFRAPGFHMDREALELIAEAGYRYDSSMFPGAQVERLPHRPLSGRALAELSMPGCAPLPFPFHPCFSLVLRYGVLPACARTLPDARRTVGLPVSPHRFRRRLTGDPSEWLGSALLYALSYLSGEHKRERCRRMLDAVRQSFEIVTTPELLESYSL